ncbi:MarR family winged helix-turn-helix transcriptional regulator [Streptomyces sp. NPDC059070]|uniref:MarR family winged helix-turn-helix transcriptional regulator n=1 Tax=unclassified Streptomyces TaxID=2593676 RepID=UPI0034E21491
MDQSIAADRAKAVEDLLDVAREHSGATVMFHTAVAARQGLGASETKTLDLLERFGPLTAKELSQHTGLAPASVTGLVDRLEAKGFVRRAKHPTDKRRVLIEIRWENVAGLKRFFADWSHELAALCDEFTTEELATVIRFLAGASTLQRRTAAGLTP